MLICFVRTFLLMWNLCNIKLTILKCIIQWNLINPQCCTTTTSDLVLTHYHQTKNKPHTHYAVTPYSHVFPDTGIHQSDFRLYGFPYSRCFIYMEFYNMWPLILDSCIWCNVFEIYICGRMCQYSVLHSLFWLMFCCMYVPHFVFPLTHWCIFVNIFEELPNCVPLWIHHFTFPPPPFQILHTFTNTCYILLLFFSGSISHFWVPDD